MSLRQGIRHLRRDYKYTCRVVAKLLRRGGFIRAEYANLCYEAGVIPHPWAILQSRKRGEHERTWITVGGRRVRFYKAT